MSSPAEATVRQAALLARGLSGGRRRGSRLTVGAGQPFWTDLREVYVPWPLPPGVGQRAGALAACVAFQCSPTKEVAARLYAEDFGPRGLMALQFAEAAAAIGWATEHLPGLCGRLGELAGGVTAAEWQGVDGPTLARAAAALAREPRRPDGGAWTEPLPPVLGGLALQRRTNSALGWALSRMLRRMLGLERLLERIGEAWAADIPVAGRDTEIDPGRNLVLPGDDEAHQEHDGYGLPYPEWHLMRHQYREDFVTVRETRVARSSLRPGRPRADLQAWFAAPLERRMQGRLIDGSDLDIDATVDALVDGLTGGTPGDRLYRDRVRCERDAAFVLLLDTSGSLARSELLEHELACADALVDAMDQAGERHAVYCFWSDTRRHVAVQVLQGFGESARLPSAAGLSPRRYTRLGAAIRHATARIGAEAARRRAILVLSDGIPFDEGYEGAYARADVAKAVEEAEQREVAVFILGVAGQDANELDELLGERLRRVPGIADLAPAIGDVHARLVAA